MSTPLVPGNRLTLLTSGAAYFPALIAEIEAAASEIHLETYIFADDATSRAVAAALARAARRGVAVRVLADGFGARDFDQGLGAGLRRDGVEVMVYRPEAGRLALRRHRLRRLHRKLSVFDGRVAFVGGINVIDDWSEPEAPAPRFDYAVRVEGPVVAQIHQATRHVWRLVRWARLGRRPPPPAQRFPRPERAGEVRAGLVIRDSLRHRADIERAYLTAIDGARDSILLANAYFLPGRRFRQALLQAAHRGVRVTLLLQGRVEYALLHYATQALYDRLIAAGIRIVEYRAGFLHAKVAVVDADWATVGSSNIDPFSLLLAREANLVVRDTGFAAGLRQSLEAACAESGIEIAADTLPTRTWAMRWISRVAYGLIRLMVGMTAYIPRRRRL